MVTFFARVLELAWTRGPKPPLAAGTAALEAGRLDDALGHLCAALTLAATSAERAIVHNKRGVVHIRRGDRCAAIAAFVDALTADPHCVAAIVNVGNLLLEDGAVADAVEHYEAALRIDDAHAAAHLNLGIAYKRLGRRGDAVREFRRANRIDARLLRRR